MWRTTNVIHAFALKIVGEIDGHIGRAVVAEKPGLLHHRCPIAPRRVQRQVQRVGDIRSLHRCAELPGDDVTAVVVEDRGQIEPTPADDLEIGEVGLPQLVRSGCLVTELIGRADHHMGWCRDQVFGLENAIR